MHVSQLFFACLFTLIQSAPLPWSSNDLLSSLDLTTDETGATAFSLLYGSPLLAFLHIANSTLTYGESNTLYNHNTTATADTRNVVKPNVDNTYAEAIFDLSATDLFLTLPPMEEDRFYLAAFMIRQYFLFLHLFYGDKFAYLGSVPASAPGKYLLQSSNSSCEGYEACITSPTSIGTLLFRVEVKNNGTDVMDVENYLNNSTLVPINPRTPSLPALTVADFDGLSSNIAISSLQLTARFESRAIPETAAYQATVPSILALAGICDGSYTQPAGVNLTIASALFNATVSAFEETPSNYPSLGNGWCWDGRAKTRRLAKYFPRKDE